MFEHSIFFVLLLFFPYFKRKKIYNTLFQDGWQAGWIHRFHGVQFAANHGAGLRDRFVRSVVVVRSLLPEVDDHLPGLGHVQKQVVPPRPENGNSLPNKHSPPPHSAFHSQTPNVELICILYKAVKLSLLELSNITRHS